VDEPPDTKYVAVGNSDVAYQVLGEGPLDLLYSMASAHSLTCSGDLHGSAAYFRHLATFCRLILFDRRGTGLSDSLSGGTLSTWEEWVEDVGAVLDAAGSRRAAIFAAVDSGPIASLFAATHPERVNALILHNSSARYLVAEDYPIGQPAVSVDEVVQLVRSKWGTVDLQLIAHPGGDEEVNRINAKIGRATATPRTAAAQFDYVLRHVDVREALPLIQAPTLIFHNRNPLVPMEHGRYLTEHIPNASSAWVISDGSRCSRGITNAFVIRSGFSVSVKSTPPETGSLHLSTFHPMPSVAAKQLSNRPRTWVST
jgi:pimeloyl-ACP methyl ester carboxylesterase